MSGELALQAAKALAYYAALLVLMRIAGKRLAGQTTTFDLIVLITLGVVLQTTALDEGKANAFVFVATVLGAHKLLAFGCARSTRLRHFVRGKPRVLVRDGRIDAGALEREAMSEEELRSGLRKLGHDKLDDVKLASLEETGQISAVARER